MASRTPCVRPLSLLLGLAGLTSLIACNGQGPASAPPSSVPPTDTPPATEDPPGEDPPIDDGPPGVILLPVEVGDVVAELGLAAPAAKGFLLHGTIPVPPGTFPRPDGLVPLVVHDHDGSPVVTQVEAVTYYADEQLGAEVVEVLARVSPPPSAVPGEQIVYAVSFAPHADSVGGIADFVGAPGIDRLYQDTANVAPAVEALLKSGAPILITATDIFGNVYVGNPLQEAKARLTRRGPMVTQLRTYDTMVPPEQLLTEKGTLPHLFGVHAYVSTWSSENALMLDLRFNNGADGSDPKAIVDDALGDIYVRSIEVLVRSGWQVLHDVTDPFIGEPGVLGNYTVHKLVEELPGGSLHLFPSQSQFHRRLALAPVSDPAPALGLLASEGQAFCRPGHDPTTGREYWSWWSPETPRYFPQSHRLPRLDHVGLDSLRADLAEQYAKLAGHLMTGEKETLGGLQPDGAYPVKAGVLGWATPYGVPTGGMVGGTEINIFEGVPVAASASNEGYRYLQLQHRMQNDRMPIALYNKSGRASRIKQWLTKKADGTLVIPFLFYNGELIGGEDVIGAKSSPDFQRIAVKNSGLQPPYESTLLGYSAIDYQHFIRYTRSPKALVWLGNDPLSKDDVLMAAESYRLGYHPYPLPGGGVQETGLLAHELEVLADPKHGLNFGRAEGWGIDAVNAAFAMSNDSSWRRDVRTWYERITHMLALGQSYSGIIQSKHSGKQFEDQFRFRHSIEGAIVENALVGMQKVAWEGAHPELVADIDTLLETSFYGLISDISWAPGEVGPWTHVALGPAGGDSSTQWETLAELTAHLPLPCGTPECETGHSPTIDVFQIGSSFAYAYELTGDPEFLERALLHTKNPLPGQTLLQKLEADGLKFLENRAALLALAQSLE